MPSTASASHSVTVRPLTVTGFVAIRPTVVLLPERPRQTLKALLGGSCSGSSSRSPSKVSLSVAPTTTADEGAGGVSLSMSAHCAMASNSFPDSSWMRFAALAGGVYANRNVSPCLAGVTGLNAGILSVLLPSIRGFPKGRPCPLPPRWIQKSKRPGTALAFNRSSKYRMSSVVFNSAAMTFGFVASVKLVTGFPAKDCTSAPSWYCSGLAAGLV